MSTQTNAGTYDVLSVLRRALGYLSPYRGRFGAGVLLTAAGIALDLVKPLPLALVLDVVLGESKLPLWMQPLLGGFSSVALLSIAAAAIVVVTFLRGACTVAANYLTIYTGQQMVNDLRTGFWAHLQK